MKVTPDKFIHLTTTADVSLDKIRADAAAKNPELTGEDLDRLARTLLSDYNMNTNAVRGNFRQFIYEQPVKVGETDSEIQDRLTAMLKLRFKSDAPRRPPRVILLGPPGSSRSTQCQMLADKFGLVHVNPIDLLKAEGERNPGIRQKAKESIENGDPLPDEIVLRLVDQRLKQSDCQVNGWVLNGFPENEAQVNMLRAMKVKPSLVIMFDQSVDESVRRLSAQKVDPHTGLCYNDSTNPAPNHAIASRLVQRPEDSESCVRKRFIAWN